MFDTRKSLDLLIAEHIILSYQGSLDGDMIDMLIQLTDKMLSKINTRLRIKKKVINILVEALQNSFHYTSQLNEDENSDILVESPFMILSKQDDGFTILTGNAVTEESAEALKQRIDSIHNLSDKELQEYYVKSLNKDELPQQGGAGLGLVDIMRRSKHNVTFDFIDTNAHYQIFSILIKVSLQTNTIIDSNEI